jgi:ABC-type bacteriocin/lantibiotic exporter with double-glycine peptidase domain
MSVVLFVVSAVCQVAIMTGLFFLIRWLVYDLEMAWVPILAMALFFLLAFVFWQSPAEKDLWRQMIRQRVNWLRRR